MLPAFFRKMSLNKQLLCLLFATLIGMIALQTFYFNRLSTLIYDKNSDYTSEIMTNVESSMVDEVDSINRMVSSIAYNDAVQQFYIEDNSLRKYNLTEATGDFLERMKSIKQGVVDFVLIGVNGNTYNLGYNAQQSAKFDSIIDQYLQQQSPSDGIHFIGVRELVYNETMSQYVVAAAPVRGIREGAHYGELIGYYFMILDANSISRQIEDLSKKTTGYFYILDAENQIMASNDTKSIGKQIQDAGDGYIITKKDIPEVGFTMVSYLPKAELFKGIEIVRIDNFMLFMILMVILFISYQLIARNLVQPLGTLFRFMNTVMLSRQTVFNERVNLEGYMEISILASKFNQMLDEFSMLTTELVDTNSRVYELQLLHKQAEIAFLNSQINPHFLYNTLECIQGIAAARNVGEINTMTAALSRIFRYSIQEKEEVLLREELEVVRHYLEIQQIRFEDRFEVSMDIQESMLNLRVKKMLLQPLVENAVFHGLELKLAKGHLQIRIRETEQGDLMLVVQDDGAGIAPERLAELQQFLAHKGGVLELDRKNKHGIGISNVHHRIQGAYGDPYGLTIESKEHVGTEVTLRLPGRGEPHVFSVAR